MVTLEILKIEEQLNQRLLYNVCVFAPEGRIDFSLGIQDSGSAALDEAALLRSTLHFAEGLQASVRSRLAPPPLPFAVESVEGLPRPARTNASRSIPI